MNAARAKAALLVLLVLVVVSVVVSISSHRKPKAEREDGKAIGREGVVEEQTVPHTDLFENGAAVTTVDGSTSTIDEKGFQHWKDLEARHQLGDGRVMTVSARSAVFDPRTQDFDVSGDVEVETSDGLRLTGIHLSRKFDPTRKSTRYVSTEPLTFERPDLTGHGNAFIADMEERRFELHNGAWFEIHGRNGDPPVKIQGPTAIHDGLARIARFPEGAEIRKAASLLNADELFVCLRPEGEPGISSIEAKGDVFALHTVTQGTDPLAGTDRLSADKLAIRFESDGSTIASMVASCGKGPASFDLTPLGDADEGRRSLAADRIEVLFEEGRARRLMASGDVVFRSHGQEGETTIAASESVATFSNGSIERAEFHDQVRLDQGARRATGQTATYVEATGVMVLRGTEELPARVEEEGNILLASSVTYSGESVEAQGNVDVTYSSNERKGTGGLASLLGKRDALVRVLASRMDSNTKASRTIFRGDVRLWKAETSIEAPKVTLLGGEQRKLVADGGSRARFTARDPGEPPVRVECRTLTLDDLGHTLDCAPSDAVRIAHGATTISGNTLHAVLDPETSAVREAKFRGEVAIVDGTRTGRGRELDYEVGETRRAVLRGDDEKPATLRMSAQGETRGEELVFYPDEDFVSATGGRTNTTIDLSERGRDANANAPR